MKATEDAKEDTGTTSAASRPSKRAKNVDRGDDLLVGVFERGTQTLADAITEAAKENALPDGLFEAVDTLPGFELEHKSMYYAYLVDHPSKAKAFVKLPFEYKLSWITKFVSDNCSF